MDDWRPYMIAEMDQLTAGIDDGDADALDLAVDWLHDLVVAGDADVIGTLLRGWRHEMEAGLAEDSAKGGSDAAGKGSE